MRDRAAVRCFMSRYQSQPVQRLHGPSMWCEELFQIKYFHYARFVTRCQPQHNDALHLASLRLLDAGDAIMTTCEMLW